jgi:hypothetical protein
VADTMIEAKLLGQNFNLRYPRAEEQIRRCRETPLREWHSPKGTLEEIRDLLRDEARMRQINENAAMRKQIVDDLERHREKVQQQTQEGGEKITPGKLALLILAALLPLPEAAAEQSRDETKQETEQAAA